MRKYLLPEHGSFYKANLHCHTTISDGKLTPEEIKAAYMEKGYSVVAYTDHDVFLSHEDLAEADFLPLNGYEMEVTQSDARIARDSKKTCHMCLVALKPDNLKPVCLHRSKYFIGNGANYADQVQYDRAEPDFEREYSHACINEIMRRGRENGFFVTYNHPTWSLERYPEYMGYRHMHAMEIFNHECVCLGHDEYNDKAYDDMLGDGKRLYCVATDDTHNPSTVGGGFTMIKAEKLEYEAITDALVAGNFYASQGPLIHSLWIEDGKVHIDCSDAVCIVVHTNTRRKLRAAAPDGEALNSAEFALPTEVRYIRITVTDAAGKHADTNAYFMDEILG